MYVQANGIECKAWRKYDRNLTKDSKSVVQEADARLEEFYVSMDNVNLANDAGMRCWDTMQASGGYDKTTQLGTVTVRRGDKSIL